MDSALFVVSETKQPIHHGGFNTLQLELLTLFPAEKSTATLSQLWQSNLTSKYVNTPHDVRESSNT